MATEMNFGIICDLFIASSSDCEKAKPIIAQACYEWNQVHGHKEKVFILPRFCEVDGYPALCRPQDQLNKVLDQCDIAVALVWYKFANGLHEELERSIQQQKKLLVYFSEKGIPPKKFNEVNMDAIENFKSLYQENVYWWSYESDEQLAELFKRQLQQTMNNLLENEIADYKSEIDALKTASASVSSIASQSATPPGPPLSEYEIEILEYAFQRADFRFATRYTREGKYLITPVGPKQPKPSDVLNADGNNETNMLYKAAVENLEKVYEYIKKYREPSRNCHYYELYAPNFETIRRILASESTQGSAPTEK